MTTRRSALCILAFCALIGIAALGAAQSRTFAQSPAPSGRIAVQVTLQAGPDAAARTWRYEVLNSAGAVVQTLSLSTNGAAPTGSGSTGELPYGSYTIRQVLGSDTRLACNATSFYEVSSPVGALTTVNLGAPQVTVPFTIRPCAALPTKLEVQIPIDTVAPVGPVVGGSPAQTPPIDEVRGIRSAGPPLAPGTGDSTGPAPSGRFPRPALLLLLVGLVATLLPSAGYALGRARERAKA